MPTSVYLKITQFFIYFKYVYYSQVPESDAIAELDSVIDSYHGKTSKCIFY